jgi:hypothetical protein
MLGSGAGQMQAWITIFSTVNARVCDEVRCQPVTHHILETADVVAPPLFPNVQEESNSK